MSKGGWSRQPCHGCGSTEPHRIGEVCHECHSLMESGRRAEEWQKTQVEYIEVHFTTAKHLVGRARIFGHTPHDSIVREADDQFERTWWRFLDAATEPATSIATHYNNPKIVTTKRTYDYPDMGIDCSEYAGLDPVRLVRHNLWEMIQELDEDLRRMVGIAYYHGVVYGSGLLRRLEEGTLTLGDFDGTRSRSQGYMAQLLERYAPKKKEGG